MKLNNSAREFKRAQKVLVGGVNSPVRAFKSVGGTPLVMERGQGSQLIDADGNAYTDYCLSWGALILGHAHKDVLTAVRRGISRGTSYGTTTGAEIELASTITQCIPSIEKIRFVNSGTEAAMSAIRLARGFSGRPLVVKFDGCYHGHCDDLLTVAGSGVAHLPVSSSRGIPQGHIANTVSLPFNNTERLAELLERHKTKVACVIVEPVPGNMGVVVPEKNFLKTLRELTRKFKIVLIFDEVMTGFRSSLGGVQADFNILPDLTCLGKIIGGGFPVGAYGGRREIMDCLAPLGSVYQAGTFSGNPVVMNAGLATLKNLDTSFYRKLRQKGEEFARYLNASFKTRAIDAYLDSYGAMLSLRFGRGPAADYEDARRKSSTKLYAQLFHSLLKQGIYLPPADLEAFFISSAHTTRDLRRLAENILKSLNKN